MVQKPQFPHHITLAFGLMLAVILGGGVAYYHQDKIRSLAEVQATLHSIADFKVNQIGQWQKERLADADVLRGNPFLTDLIQRWLETPTPESTDTIRDILRTTVQSYGYANALVLDEQGKILFSVFERDGHAHPLAIDGLQAAWREQRVVMSDLHQLPGKPAHVDFLVPLRVKQPCVIALQSKAEDFLYPLLHTWPVPSETAETLFVRRAGDDVLFLSAVRFQTNAAFKLRIPLTQTDCPAVQAVLGRQDFFEGVDHRGVKVLSSLCPVPNTPWFLVAKVDEAEVFESLSENFWNTGTTMVLLSLTFLALFFYVKKERRAQLDLQESEERHRLLFSQCRDAMMTLNAPDWFFTSSNPACLELFGVKDEAEFCRLKPWEVSPEVQPDGENSIAKAKAMITRGLQQGSHYFEWTHQRRDGRLFLATVLLSRMEQGGKIFLEATVRDITAQRKAEGELQLLNERLEQTVVERTAKLVSNEVRLQESLGLLTSVVEHAPMRIFWKDRELRYLGCNSLFADDSGFSCPDELIGKNDFDMAWKEQAELYRADDRQVMESGIAKLGYEEPLTAADGRRLWLRTSKVPLQDADGKTVGVLGIIEDITARKQSEVALQQSERNYREIFKSVNDAVFIHDATSGAVLDANDAMLKLYGVTYDEALRLHPNQVSLGTSPYGLTEATEWMQRAIQEGPQSFEWQARRKNGELFWVEVNLKNALINGHNRIIALVRDITERKQVAAALQTSRQHLQTLVDTAFGWFWEVDEFGRYTYVSAKVKEYLGYEPGELLGRTPFEFMPESEARRVEGDFHRIVSRREPIVALENTNVHKLGHLVILETNGQPVFGPDEELNGYRGMDRDVTEQYLAKARLAKAHERAAALAQLSRELAEDITPNTAALSILKFAQQMLGWDAAWLREWNEDRKTWTPLAVFDLLDGQVHEFPPNPSSVIAQSPIIVAAMQEGQLLLRASEADAEATLPVYGSQRRSLSLMFVPMRAAGRLIGLMSIQSYQPQAYNRESLELLQTLADYCAGALDRIRASAALVESEVKYRALSEESLVGVFVIQQGRFNYVNATQAKIFGRSPQELMALPTLADIIPPEDRSRLEEQMRQLLPDLSGGIRRELTILHKDGSRRVLEISATATKFGGQSAILGTSLDITERKKIEAQMLRKQRLESIGTLAGGVAHDLNNALSPILMVIEMLRADYPQEREMVDLMEASVRRGADMVKQLLTFARGVEGERLRIQCSHLLKEMEKIIKGTFPKNIQLQVRLQNELPTVLGDVTQLHQVLLNLCVNARDAMPQGGTLAIEAATTEVDAVYAGNQPEIKPGRYVVLRVRDTGTGISPEIVDRIFDPFFTTKELDKGTGLGLSTVMGIVKSHGGFVQVASQVGKGSVFNVHLPAEVSADGAVVIAADAPDLRGNGETILFVDDEPGVRKIALKVMERLNFKPITAVDGNDGLVVANQYRGVLRAIVTDMHMPHMDGLTFARAIRKTMPDVPIVIASGRLDDHVAAELKAIGVTDRLDKPFTERQLVELLKKIFVKP